MQLRPNGAILTGHLTLAAASEHCKRCDRLFVFVRESGSRSATRQMVPTLWLYVAYLF